MAGGIGFVLGLFAGVKIGQASKLDRTRDEMERSAKREASRQVRQRWTDEGLRDRGLR